MVWSVLPLGSFSDRILCMTWQLLLFGSPRLEQTGRDVILKRRKRLALLTYLVVTGQTHSREALATLLWPEYDTVQGKANLRRELSVLLGTIGKAALVVSRTEIGVNPAFELACDVVAFRELLGGEELGETAVSPTHINQLQQAIALYQADFLAGFDLHDCPEFNEWQFFQREELRRLAMNAAQTLVAWAMAEGAYEKGVEYGRFWLSLDPCHEPAHRELMKLYALSDQMVAAVRQYNECVRLLDKELGIAPEAQTTALLAAIKANEFGVEVGANTFGKETIEGDWARQGDEPLFNLPVPVTPFVGRERETADVQALLAEPEKRLLTLVAPGGMGKTRMALAAATAVADSFAHGVVFVSLVSATTAEHFLVALADSLHFQLGGQEPKKSLFQYLHHQQLLLILDNFEQLLAEAGLVTDLLQAAPQVQVLVTSRERLNLLGETFFTLGGLDWHEGIDEQLSSAGQLFWQHAQMVRSGLTLQAESRRYVNEICRLVQGMPLALILAAGWVDVLTVAEIAAEIRHGLDFLATELVDVPERQRSIGVVFDSSWQRLSAAEQTVFARLSVFREGFTRQAAQVVVGANVRVLRGLTQKLFVMVENGRYQIHELLRQYGAEKLTDLAETQAKHGVYYLHWLAEMEGDLRGKLQFSALQAVEADMANVRRAWFWAVVQGGKTAVNEALESLHLFVDIGARYVEGIELLEQAERRFAPPLGAPPTLLWGRIAGRLSFMRLFALGDEGLESVAKQCLTIAEQAQDRYEIALNLMMLGHLSMVQNDFEVCTRLLEQSLTHFRSLSDTLYISRVLNLLGISFGFNRDVERANVILQESLDVARRGGHLSDEPLILNNLAEFNLLLGHYAQAETYFQEARSLGVAFRKSVLVAYTEVMLGLVYFLRGDFEMATRWVRRGKANSVGLDVMVVHTIAAAISSIQAAMRGDYELALQRGEVAVQNPFNDRTAHILAHWAMALAYDGVDEDEMMWHYVRGLWEHAQAAGATAVYTWMLPITAHLLAKEGRWETAVQHLSLAHHHPLSPTDWLENWPRPAQWREQWQQQLGEVRFQKAWQAGVSLDPQTLLLEIVIVPE